METIYRIVTPFDFDEKDVLRLYREGKLFIEVERQPLPTREDVKAELLEYVSRIKEYCSPQYREYYEQIWLDIFNSEVLGSDLVMKKGARLGKLNKYKVMAFVCYLSENKMYIDFKTIFQLYCKLENTTKKGPIYTGIYGEYAVQKCQKPPLNKLLKKYNSV